MSDFKVYEYHRKIIFKNNKHYTVYNYVKTDEGTLPITEIIKEILKTTKEETVVYYVFPRFDHFQAMHDCIFHNEFNTLELRSVEESNFSFVDIEFLAALNKDTKVINYNFNASEEN